MELKMNAEATYYILLVLLMVIGFYLINDGLLSSAKGMVRHKTSTRRGVKKFLANLSDSGVDEIFLNAGVNLSMKKYTAFRNLVMLILFALIAIASLSSAYQDALRLTILAALGYLITYPQNTFRGKKTPFKLIFDAMYRARQDKKDDELFSVITQMKNVILSQSPSSVSSDYLFSKLLRFTSISKPIFLGTQLLIIKGRKDEAGKYFANAYDTKLGRDFARIIPKLDELPPKEFLEQLTLFQNTMREIYQTKKEKKHGRNMLIMTTLSTLEVTLIILNFMYLVLVDTITFMNF